MERDKLANPQNPNNQLEQVLSKEELARQKKEYKLVLESLFTDETDTKSVKLWAIISGLGVIVNFLILLGITFFK